MNREKKEEIRKKIIKIEDILPSTTLYDKNNID